MDNISCKKSGKLFVKTSKKTQLLLWSIQNSRKFVSWCLCLNLSIFPIFGRFLYDECRKTSDFFEETCPKIARYARLDTQGSNRRQREEKMQFCTHLSYVNFMKKETFKEGITEAFNGLKCILQWTRSKVKLEIIEEMLERFQSQQTQ